MSATSLAAPPLDSVPCAPPADPQSDRGAAVALSVVTEAATPVRIRRRRPDPSQHDELARLFERTHDHMRRLAYVLIGGDDDLDDIVQEAYRSVFQRLRRGGVICPDAYVYSTVVNGCARHRRTRAVRRDHVDDRPELIDEASAELTCVGLRYEDVAATRDELWSALDVLSADQRTAIVLRFFEDRSYSDIAAILSTPARDVPEVTVRAWVRRGLRRLRSELGS